MSLRDLVSLSEVEVHLLAGRPIIDVRAPVEFVTGSLPGSVNIPIMDDDQRAQVGTVYKRRGQEAAIKLGHELVSGKVKEQRLDSWKSFIQKNPATIVTCFRGGLRSKITQQWLAEAGVVVPRIEGGYKKIRQYLMDATIKFSQGDPKTGQASKSLIVLSGATGSGKTLLLRSLNAHRLTCDLEQFANHRGSAFGGYKEGQPAQINFENRLALSLIKAMNADTQRALVIEDESRLIGRNVQPPSLFEHLRSSPLVLIEESLESRVDVTFDDYILGSAIQRGVEAEALEVFAAYKGSLDRITKKLGGLRAKEILDDLIQSEKDYLEHRELSSNRVWIGKLLDWYYDPMYLGSLASRSPSILFRGSREQCRQFLLTE